jgi:hypothetical protein
MPIYLHPLTVFTSRYSCATLATSSGLAAVSISRWPPRFPLAYALRVALYDLAPTAGLLRLAREEGGHELFADAYARRLDALGPGEVVRQLRCAQGDERAIVMLCFEDVRLPDRTCHRTILGAWLERELGLVVQELPDDTVPGRKKKPPPDTRQDPLL